MLQTPSSQNSRLGSIPIICKIIMIFNILLWISQLIFPQTMGGRNICLQPSSIINNPSIYFPTLWIANFFHSNPIYSGPMGILHIIINMMTLMNVGTYLEKKLGSIAFLGITLFFVLFIGPIQIPLALFTNFITQGHIPLLSLNQCGIGYSAVLFGYFIVMLKLTPGETTNFCGMTVAKWIQPLLQLILLSMLINASFIGHLSGIIIGFIYITGIPGFFNQRQKFIKYFESLKFLQFITKRNDFYSASQQPCFDHFDFSFLLKRRNRSPQGTTYNQLSRANALGGVSGRQVGSNTTSSVGQMISGGYVPRGGTLSANNKYNNNSNVEMTIINGELVPKNNQTNNTIGSGSDGI